MNIRFCPRASAMLVVLALQACGGASDVASEQRAHASGSGRAHDARAVPEALFGRDGQPSTSARHPPEGWRHYTAAGLYATPAQAAWEALTVEPYTVLVDVDTHPSAAAAIDKTLRDFRWSRDSAHAAFYVRADAPEQAVLVADALTAAGLPRVFLVVEQRS
jgi:hypothetical protein